jgi:phosphoglycolate phosphatase-like HAD superfamily hydrolase
VTAVTRTRVLFWDIDGTLLTTARAGVFALEEAARELGAGDVDFARLRTAGLTDAEVARLSLETAGVAAGPEEVTAFLRVYERFLPERLGWREGAVLPGVREILDDLASADVVSLLLTGNTRAGAAAKLAHYALDDYFEGGAFCADVDDRVTIARRALEQARGHVEGLQPADCVVVGDTPHDVRCGQAIGARTVAVATGGYGLDELEACGPDHALERLPEPEAFRALLSIRSRRVRT